MDFPHVKTDLNGIFREIAQIEKEIGNFIVGYNIGIDLNNIARNNKDYYLKFGDIPIKKPFRISYDVNRLPVGDEMLEILDNIPKLSGVIFWDSFNKKDVADILIAADLVAKSTKIEPTICVQIPIDDIDEYKMDKSIRIASTFNNIVRFFGL